jgi:hypothetical protein
MLFFFLRLRRGCEFELVEMALLPLLAALILGGLCTCTWDIKAPLFLPSRIITWQQEAKQEHREDMIIVRREAVT